ncbi:MAG: 4'-phosphopantetheinyl transferase superfamily protein, partial [Deltaproteobacteria bacterium]|nr:4'-phosphopantetheinyl transferase superfamily protein [Deltaproteobacteria bacterium]
SEKSLAVMDLLISADERVKAGDFIFSEDKTSFTAAHSLLRLILSRQVNIPPLSLKFVTNRYGKPELCISSLSDEFQLNAKPLVNFNLSHIKNMVAVAISNNPCGVDLCSLTDEIPTNSLTSGEIRSIKSIDKKKQSMHFAAIWSIKEAYLKATGKGLNVQPENIEVKINDENIEVYNFGIPETRFLYGLWNFDSVTLGVAVYENTEIKIIKFDDFDELMSSF